MFGLSLALAKVGQTTKNISTPALNPSIIDTNILISDLNFVTFDH
jgi:hypothetical protein